MQAVNNDLAKVQLTPKRTKPNLSKVEWEAMENFSTQEDKIISMADKGGAIVIQDVDDYDAEANRQLRQRILQASQQNAGTQSHGQLSSEPAHLRGPIHRKDRQSTARKRPENT